MSLRNTMKMITACSLPEFREILVANMNDETEIMKKIGYLETRKSDITKEIEKYTFTLKRIQIERCLIEEAKTSRNVEIVD